MASLNILQYRAIVDDTDHTRAWSQYVNAPANTVSGIGPYYKSTIKIQGTEDFYVLNGPGSTMVAGSTPVTSGTLYQAMSCALVTCQSGCNYIAFGAREAVPCTFRWTIIGLQG